MWWRRKIIQRNEHVTIWTTEFCSSDVEPNNNLLRIMTDSQYWVPFCVTLYVPWKLFKISDVEDNEVISCCSEFGKGLTLTTVTLLVLSNGRQYNFKIQIIRKGKGRIQPNKKLVLVILLWCSNFRPKINISGNGMTYTEQIKIIHCCHWLQQYTVPSYFHTKSSATVTHVRHMNIMPVKLP